MRIRLLVKKVCGFAVAALVVASPAAAQGGGPLTLLPSRDRTLVAPEVKVTDINGTTGTLVGVSVGRELDGRLFIGGAGYWLADPRETTRLSYLGLVAGWQVVSADRLHLSVRGLIGGGNARVYSPSPIPLMDRRWPWGGRMEFAPWPAAWRDSVFIAEPEVRVAFDLGDACRLTLGGGYRLTGASGWLGDRLEGATGTFSLEWRLGR